MPKKESSSRHRGFSVRCPDQGCNSDEIQVNLADLDTVKCPSCGRDFKVSEVAALIQSWRPVVEWLQTAPVKESG